jgi:TolA-binding protein
MTPKRISVRPIPLRMKRNSVWLAAALALMLLPGCKSGLNLAARTSPLEERASIDGVMGPTERRLHGEEWERRRSEMSESGISIEGLVEYEAAQKLYDAGDYATAEKSFKTLARQRGRAGKTWQTRWQEIFAGEKPDSGGAFNGFGDPIEEDALYMVGECQFAQKKYSWAQDSYGRLLEEYPSTRHLDNVTRRLFTVARYWLQLPGEDSEQGAVQLVEHTEGGDKAPSIKPPGGVSRWPVVPNLADRTRPVFDTNGRALQALESIWQHDATGPLADDALMLQATYYHTQGDYVEAARLYGLVRDEYPDSAHFQDAFLLGSHVTLASYSGPEYDDSTLSESKRLKETARRIFADLSAEQRQRLDEELDRIRDAEVEREWAKVQFYLRKNQPASVALHCNQIINRFPNSKYAEQAAELLQQQQQAVGGMSWVPWRRPRGVDGAASEGGGAQVRPVPATTSEESTAPSASPGTQNSLTPVERAPDLKRVQPGRATLDDTDTVPSDEHPARVRL